MTTNHAEYDDYKLLLADTIRARATSVMTAAPQHVRLQYSKPLEPSEYEKLDNSLSGRLPKHLRKLFTEIASSFEFSWGLRDCFYHQNLESPIFVGHMEWNAHRMEELDRIKRHTEQGTVFEPLWCDKLPLVDFGNGDYLAVSEKNSQEDVVYYLTPEDPPNCVVEFRQPLKSFILDWGKLACVGDSSLLQFRDDDARRLDLEKLESMTWLSWLDSRGM